MYMLARLCSVRFFEPMNIALPFRPIGLALAHAVISVEPDDPDARRRRKRRPILNIFILGL